MVLPSLFARVRLEPQQDVPSRSDRREWVSAAEKPRAWLFEKRWSQSGRLSRQTAFADENDTRREWALSTTAAGDG